MNGKAARALRHLQANTLNIRDVGIISRRMKVEEAKIGTGPKPLITRQRKPAQGHGPSGRDRTSPLIVQNPVHAVMKRYLALGLRAPWSNLTSGHARSARAAGRSVPKHVLDRLSQ